MVNLTQQTKIFLAIKPIDFRSRMDGTAGVCRRLYEKDPLDGAVYVFRNNRSTMIRLYFFDGLSEWCCDVRIANGRFPFWPNSDEPLSALQAHQLYLLLRGANPSEVKSLPDWKKLA